MGIISWLKDVFHRTGYQLVPYPSEDIRVRLDLIKKLHIDVVLDVGANIGEYAQLLRKNNYHGQIISFEPLHDEYQKLKSRAARDNHWQTMNLAIGMTDEDTEINISANSVSSSIMQINKNHLEAEPKANFVGKQTVKVNKLDTLLPSIIFPGSSVMLKLDVQGYEKYALAGAIQSLPNIKIIQVEMSIKPLYENSFDSCQCIAWLHQHGFEVYNLENGFRNLHSGQLFQVDGIFVNTRFWNY